MELFDIIRSAGGGEIINALAAEAGLEAADAEQALRALLPELGHAIRRAGESPSAAATVHAAMHDERYARYLEDPAALREAAAVADGERVLLEVLDDHERSALVRRVAAAIGPDEGQVRKLLPWSPPSPWPRSGKDCARRRRKRRPSRHRRFPGTARVPTTVSTRRS